MPTFYDDAETPIVQFDPLSEVSPFALFRKLQQGREILIVDLRPSEARGSWIRGSVNYPGDDWLPEPEAEVVLVDDDGRAAVPVARKLLSSDRPRVRALFGGMELYEFSLDPDVVGSDTFLERSQEGKESGPGEPTPSTD